jgi:hypothetical protein
MYYYYWIKDDNVVLQNCLVSESPSFVDPEDRGAGIAELYGKCCDEAPNAAICMQMVANCELWDSMDIEDESNEEFCLRCCERGSGDWRPSKVWIGAIVGFVFVGIVVLAIVTCLVYFLITKKTDRPSAQKHWRL